MNTETQLHSSAFFVRVLRLAFLTLLTVSTQPAWAQAIKVGSLDNIHEEIRNRLGKPVSTTYLFNVTGVEKFTEQVLEADELVFAPGATLELAARDLPWAAIHVRKLRFSDASAISTIRWVPVEQAQSGQPGSTGQPGKNGGRRGRHGVRGGVGHDGGPGGSGAHGMQPPTLYLIVEEVIFPSPPTVPKLSIEASGSPGGPGGIGGKGGDGGSGGKGKDPSSGAFDCRRGPGSSADGGAGGRGGQGGPGGIGGDGGDVVFIGTQQAISILSYSAINNNGGNGGVGGQGGSPGSGGIGGARVRGKGHCGGSSAGARGSSPSPSSLGIGPGGANGTQGTTLVITVPQVFQ